jgi:pyruvate/2-oxoglutarate dehydrogenase complex dihydrolipoamide dehydrogenase (E3) component
LTDYDVVVIGAGPTGENVADRAVRGGLTAVIVESELVGGECSYWACMPSKALLRPVAAVSEATHLEGVHGAQLDPPGVLDRRDSFASHWNDHGQVKWLNGAHIGLVRGRGRLTGPKTVSVSPAEGPPLELRARQAVVIATGTRATVPPIPGLAEARPWTSREATSAHEVPGRLAIIGGGVVGSEMACAWQSLGAQVTLAVREERLLDRMEDFAGTMVADGLAALGADVRCGVDVVSVARPQPGGPLTLTLDDRTTVEADEVLTATGREPHTDDLGLETVGLKPGGWLDVDGVCQVTSVDGGWLYAAGDVNHISLLTHMGKYQARVCGDAIAARARGRTPASTAWADQSAVPQVIFTTPEVASVGLTSAEAAGAGRTIRVVDYELGAVAGAKLFEDGYRGKARMVVDEDRQTMIGATLAGPGVGEMIHAATVAVAGQVPLHLLWHAVPSYPTMSEVWLRLLETYGL